MFVHVTPAANTKNKFTFNLFRGVGGWDWGANIFTVFVFLVVNVHGICIRVCTGYLYICICILFIFTVFVFVFIHRVFVFLYFIPQLPHFRTQGDNSQARIQCQH